VWEDGEGNLASYPILMFERPRVRATCEMFWLTALLRSNYRNFLRSSSIFSPCFRVYPWRIFD